MDAIFHGISGFAAHPCADEFRAAQLRLKLGDLNLIRYECAGIQFRASLADTLHVGIPVHGSVQAKSRNGAICTRPFVLGNALAPYEAFSLDVLPGSVAYTVEIPLAAIARQAHALVEDAGVLDMIAHGIDLQSQVGAALLRNVLAIFNEFPALATAGLGPLAVASFSELLVNLILTATLPKLRARLADAPPQIGPGKAERARQYLTAHAHEPIRIADLAAEMGIGMRALQAGFRRQVGCSPRQYLLKCRLELARARLLSPTPMDTVSSIAVDCGFLNLGLFASRYRKSFGELPSQTLGRTRNPLGTALVPRLLPG
jgi:AraC-like DNA-binding protein